MKKEKPEPTLHGLATALGTTRQLIARYRKKPGAPPLDKVDAWAEFIATHGNRSESLPVKQRAALTRERIRLVKAQADKAEGEEKVRRGELIPMELVKRMITYVVGTFFENLDRLAQELPPNLVGLTAPQIALELKREKTHISETTTKEVYAWIEAEKQKTDNLDSKEAK
jgi:hypothetical protein